MIRNDPISYVLSEAYNPARGYMLLLLFNRYACLVLGLQRKFNFKWQSIFLTFAPFYVNFRSTLL